MNFHNDKIIKLDYNPVLDAQIDYANAVGATDSLTLRTLDFTPTDANTIFVKKTGNDSTAVGTQADPVLTIKKAESLITATKINIVILDDGVYEEESLAFDTNCVNIAAAIGKKPTVKPILVTRSISNFLINTLKNHTVIASSGSQYGTSPKVTGLSDGNFAILYTRYDGSSSHYLCIQVIDCNGVIIKSETILRTLTSTPLAFSNICTIGTSFVAAVQEEGVDVTYFWVLDNLGNVSCASSFSTVIHLSDPPLAVTGVGGYDDRFAIIHLVENPLNTRKIYCSIFTLTGTALVSSQLLSNYAFNVGEYSCGAVRNPNGGFILFFRTYTTNVCRWIVVDNDGNAVHSNSFAADINWISGVVNSNETSIIFACSDTSNNVKFVEYSLADYSVIKSLTTVYTPSDSTMINLSEISNGNFVVTSGAANGSIYFINRDWEVLASESISSTNRGFHHAYCEESNSVFVGFPSASSPYYIYEYIKGGLLTDWFTFSSDITINGLTFNDDEKHRWRYIYSSSGNLKIKWATFENITRPDYKDSDNYTRFIIDAVTASVEISNCSFIHNNAGINITSNSVLIRYCQFFKQLLNSAIKVIGSGTGIIISHNDFLYNYICIELEDNAGTEIIKNNIFYTSLLYAIKAETAVTYSHSVENSVSLNATPGTQVIRSNPHYVNDGYVTLADMDLTLKSRELGYRFESPAIGIGDDLKNAGSLEYSIADGSQTWLTMTVVKPKIKKGYNPVGAIETSYKDGSVESYRDSYSEVLKLEWDSIKEEDFLQLLSLYFSSSNLVRIYLDPIREPGSYGTYALIYDKVNASPTNWQFDDIGKNDFDLTFKRAYNEGD